MIFMSKYVFFLAFSLPAQVINVSVAGVTNTQAVLQYTAPDSSACTVVVSTSPTFTPLVHDLDPLIFTGSNLDNRTGSVAAGLLRTFVVGKRAAEQGINGHWYSRALEALTQHYYQITCGSLTATGSFTTSNIALGNTYNEALPPAPSATSNRIYSYTGQYAWPEFLNWDPSDITARQEVVIDPQTGMSLKRMTMPQDLPSTNNTAALQVVTAPTGGWANKDSVLTDDSSSATYSGTTSDWLVITDPSVRFDYGDLGTVTFSTKAWCSGPCAGADAAVEVCLTVNSVSCWPTPANVHDIVLGTTANPSMFATFGGNSLATYPWTPPGIPPLLSWDAKSRTGKANVDASGNVTWTGSGDQFYPGWSAGSKITIGGSLCTIASVTNPQALAISPSSCPGLTLPQSNIAYSGGNFGVMIRKKTSSTDTITIQYVTYSIGNSSMEWPSGGFTKLCSSTATQNSVTGHLGYHCVVGNARSVYWVDSTTGDANYLGNLTTGSHGNPDGWANAGCNNGSVTFAGSGPTDPERFYCIATEGTATPLVLGCTLTTTNQPGSFASTCQNLTPASSGKDIFSLIASFTAQDTPSFDTTQFNGLGIVASQNGQLVLNSFRGYQDSAAWVVIFNPTLVGSAPGCVGGGNPGCVVAAQSTWKTSPCRWCTLHTQGYAGESNTIIVDGKYFGDSPGDPGAGWYTVTVTSGSMTSTPSIAAGTGGCPAGSKGCDLVTVDGEPCNMAPAGPLGPHPSEPLNCPKNNAWTYLQDAAPGDVFETANGAREFMKLISKNGNQWMFQRALGWPTATSGPTTPVTPIRLVVDCLARDDDFNYSVPNLAWIWDFLADPHGLNVNNSIRVLYNYDHGFQLPTAMGGGSPWFDPNAAGYGYSILDGPGYGPPNKYGQIGPTFAGANGLTMFVDVADDHLSHAQEKAPDSEQKWFLDARPMNGPGPSLIDQATLVSGQLYKFTAMTSDGDNLKSVGGAPAEQTLITRKLQPTGINCGTQPLIDVSSAAQGNMISDDASSLYQTCTARKSGECRMGSSPGDIYMNCPFVNPRFNFSGTYGCNVIFPEPGLGLDLCASNTGAYLNGITQIGYQETYDRAGALGRTLTHGLIHYRLNNVNQNVRTTPDGKWLLFPAYYFGGTEFQILSGKMLPYPAVDSIDRSTFIPMALQLSPPDGLGVDNTVVQFGYAENGPPDQFYCTSRREGCLAAAANVPTVPFKFPSDSTSGSLVDIVGSPCSSGCTIAIPALSQRVVYYQVLYRDSSNRVVAQTPTQATVTP
jgi:hypothetical protein